MPRPVVPEHLMWLWRGYQRLSPDRPWRGGGFGSAIPGAIPWTSVAAWIEYHGYGEAEAEMFDYCIRALDTVYIEHYHKKASRNAKGHSASD